MRAHPTRDGEPAAGARQILAVDDERQILRALRLILRSAGFAVVTAASVEEALDRVALSPVDAAIIDLLLPDGDGVELTARLREWSDMPIIVLSAVGEEEQKIRALGAGADDYVTKPFAPGELVARIEAVLRRVAPAADTGVVDVADLRVDLVARVVLRGGEAIHLTPTEFALLRVLVLNRGRLMTHRALLTEVWGPGYSEDVTVLRGQMANLRRKLNPPGAPRRHYVRTEPGVGYRFEPT